MKPTFEQYLVCAQKFARYIPFWPRGEAEEKDMVAFLDSMVGTVDQLAWYSGAVLNGVSKWPGFAELRGMFCARYTPADGFTAPCTMPGFTAADCESEFRERQMRESDRALAAAKQEFLSLPPAADEPEALPIAEVVLKKTLPHPGNPKKSLREAEAELAAAAAQGKRLTEEERDRRLDELSRILKAGTGGLVQ